MLTHALLASAMLVAVHSSPPDALNSIVTGPEELGLAEHDRAEADLNGDGRNEVFLYDRRPEVCGSGGCRLLVLSPINGEHYRVVLLTTVTRLPISILPAASHDWRDIGVTVAGGGVTRPYVARLRFDGAAYPSNPTLAPAVSDDERAGAILADIGGR